MSLEFRNKGKRWTAQEKNIMLDMLHNHSVDDIAIVLKRPVPTVISKMRKMGIKVRVKSRKTIKK